MPLAVSAIGETEASLSIADTLILMPNNYGREVRILEGENVSLRLSDGSRIEGVLQDVAAEYVVVANEKVYLREIKKIGINSANGSDEGKKKRGRAGSIFSILLGGGLILLIVGLVAGVDLESLIGSVGGSDPISDLINFLLWLVGIVLLGVVILVAAVFLLPILFGGVVAFFSGLFGFATNGSNRRISSRKKRGMYNTEKDYSIKTGIAK
ncbi:MAG: hypothetical protein AAFN10_18305 [Bacteroidota bacterium]